VLDLGDRQLAVRADEGRRDRLGGRGLFDHRLERGPSHGRRGLELLDQADVDGQAERSLLRAAAGEEQ
jgi:hypothetical protein